MGIEQISLAELKSELAATKVTRGIQEVVLHHTWSPSAAQYRGKATWEAIRQYHVNERKWSDIGYHYGVAPDGTVWRLRAVTKSGAHVLNRNGHTVGVAMIGNFDKEDPVANGLERAAEVVAALVQRFKLTVEQVRFHREFQPKSCPGTRVELGDFRGRVARHLGQKGEAEGRTVKMIDHATGKQVGSFELVAGGDHIADQGKVYVNQVPGVSCQESGSD